LYCGVARSNVNSPETRLADQARIWLGGVLVDVSRRISEGGTYLAALAEGDPIRPMAEARLAVLTRAQVVLLGLVSAPGSIEQAVGELQASQAATEAPEAPADVPDDSEVVVGG
jgi:hypothetical protein